MAEKLTDKGALVGTPSNNDLLHIVDVSDTSSSTEGTSKKISIIDLLSSVVKKAGNETITGLKTFASSIVIPEPTLTTNPATKNYVDNAVGGTPSGCAVFLTSDISSNSTDVIFDEDGTSGTGLASKAWNTGDYDKVTGKFTAPSDGTYVISFYINTRGYNNTGSTAVGTSSVNIVGGSYYGMTKERTAEDSTNADIQNGGTHTVTLSAGAEIGIYVSLSGITNSPKIRGNATEVESALYIRKIA